MTQSPSPSVDEVADPGRDLADKLLATHADLAAGWEITSLPKLGRHVCWVTDPKELLPTLQSIREQGMQIVSVLPVAALRRASLVSPPKAGEGEADWMTARKDALERAKGIDGGDFAGCLEPPNDLATTLAIIAAGYEFTLDVDGRLAALVAGDMGYASTDIVLEPEVMKVIGPALKPNHEARGDGVRVTDEMVERAAIEIWNDRVARYAGEWPGMSSNLVAVISTVATARAALEAALSAPLTEPAKAEHVGAGEVAWRWRAKVKGEWGLWSVVEVDPNDWTWREYWDDLEVQPLSLSGRVE